MAGAVVRIAGLPGDGIGPEVYLYARRLFEAANQVLGRRALRPQFYLQDLPYDADYYLAQGMAWPPGTAEELAHDYDASFLIALGDPRVPGGGMAHAREIILDGFRGHPSWFTNFNYRPTELIHPALRPSLQQGPFRFELFALDSPAEEITESVEESGTEQEVVVPTEVHSRNGFEKMLRDAVMRARDLGETKVIVLHKNNVFRHSHGSWEDVCKRVASEMDVRIEMQLIDSFLERLVRDPRGVPAVIVTDRAFGSVVGKAIEALNRGGRKEIPKDFSIVLGRENIEGMYLRKGGVVSTGTDLVGTQIGRHSYRLIGENIRTNLKIAKDRRRDGITLLHLDDVHPASYTLWRRVATEQARLVGMKVRLLHAGEFMAGLISDPASLNGEVIAADNILGDICGDGAAALVGGMGIPATASWNTDGSTGRYFFEPLHGSAPDKAGRNIANPMATLLTVGELFQAYGYSGLRLAVHVALYNLLESGMRTYDMRQTGYATTTAFGDAFIDEFLQVTAAC